MYIYIYINIYIYYIHTQLSYISAFVRLICGTSQVDARLDKSGHLVIPHVPRPLHHVSCAPLALGHLNFVLTTSPGALGWSRLTFGTMGSIKETQISCRRTRLADTHALLHACGKEDPAIAMAVIIKEATPIKFHSTGASIHSRLTQECGILWNLVFEEKIAAKAPVMISRIIHGVMINLSLSTCEACVCMCLLLFF